MPKACAAEVANSSLDKIITLYRDKASSWENTLKNYALTLFFLLAAIEFAISAIRLALRGSDASEWLAELVDQVLFLGFFLALLNNSSAWAKAIVDSFRAAANQAAISSGGLSNLAPSDIFDTGLSIASKVADQTSLFSPASSLGLIVCALVILIAFALIAAFLIVSLVESYVVISASVLLMGFGGSRFTKDYAVRTMTYAVSRSRTPMRRWRLSKQPTRALFRPSSTQRNWPPDLTTQPTHKPTPTRPALRGPFAFPETLMSNQHQQNRATAARAALSAREQTSDDLATRLQDHLTDLGHLCDAENLIFTDILARALKHWAVERIDPNSLTAGPTVEIGIGSEGLPDKPKKRPGKPMPKKSRPA